MIIRKRTVRKKRDRRLRADAKGLKGLNDVGLKIL
jgi:hypothetical protein